MRRQLLCLAGVAGLAMACGAAGAQQPRPAGQRVEIEGGNIILGNGRERRRLTNTGRDAEAVLSPDGTSVVFTRLGKARPAGSDADDPGTCEAPFDALMRIGVDGRREETLLEGRGGDKPEEQLCGFSRKQFSSDGRSLYFLAPAWTTSAALHVYDLRGRQARFVRDANDVVVLSACDNRELRDHLLVMQHRYYVFGGSYDWYWLYDPAGRKEIGPVGEAEGAEAALKLVADSGRCEKP